MCHGFKVIRIKQQHTNLCPNPYPKAKLKLWNQHIKLNNTWNTTRDVRLNTQKWLAHSVSLCLLVKCLIKIRNESYQKLFVNFHTKFSRCLFSFWTTTYKFHIFWMIFFHSCSELILSIVDNNHKGDKWKSFLNFLTIAEV